MTANEIHSALLSVYMEWDTFLSNPRFTRNRNEISWQGYQRREFVDVITASFVSNLAEEGQYSLQVTKDGSIFQLYYRFDNRNRELVSANLAFLFSGNNYVDDETRVMADEMLTPTPDLDVGWIRIDYSNDASDDGGVTHPKCHMHLSHFPDARLIVDRVPNPKQFVEFIISICYPEEYKEKRLDEDGKHIDKSKMCTINDPLPSDLNITEICTYSPYLRIPTATVPPIPIPDRGSARR